VKKSVIIANFIWLTVALAVCAEAWRLKVGHVQTPGPGFVPFVAGAFFAVFALINLFQSWKETKGETASLAPARLWRPAVLMLVLFLYVGFFEILGFVPATLALLLFLFRLIEPLSWKLVILGSALTTGTIYLLFGVILGSSLPRGFLGF